MQTVIFWNNFH